MSIDALRAGFHAYFGEDGPELPDPIPAKGSVSGGGWRARYVLNQDAAGRSVLDFLVDYGMPPPVHGRVNPDGSAVTVGTFLDHYVINPAMDHDEDAARARMEQHNREVADELERVGLL